MTELKNKFDTAPKPNLLTRIKEAGEWLNNALDKDPIKYTGFGIVSTGGFATALIAIPGMFENPVLPGVGIAIGALGAIPLLNASDYSYRPKTKNGSTDLLKCTKNKPFYTAFCVAASLGFAYFPSWLTSDARKDYEMRKQAPLVAASTIVEPAKTIPAVTAGERDCKNATAHFPLQWVTNDKGDKIGVVNCAIKTAAPQ